MKRIVVSIIMLLTVLSAGSLYADASVHRATASPAGPVPVGAPLQPFVATGLQASHLIGVPQHVHIPAGYTLKHMHPGNRYVYIISGSEQITDDQGTRTYGAGAFFWEPAWHVHTVHVLSDVEAFFLTFVAPGDTQHLTLPVK